MRVAVVGASSGLGRCIAIDLVERGHSVALLARRKELLDSAVTEAGGDAHAFTCDVTSESSCRDAVAASVGALGGLDGVVYATGMGVLRRIEELEPAEWLRTFETNVVGASVFTAAALPHLADSQGVVAYLSSVSASYTAPWPGLASYTVTKAALDKLVEAWRSEHANVGFTRVVVGDCSGGEGEATSQFLAGMDPALLGELYPVWMARGLLAGTVYEVEALITMIESVLRLGATAAVPSVTLVPRQPSLRESLAAG